MTKKISFFNIFLFFCLIIYLVLPFFSINNFYKINQNIFFTLKQVLPLFVFMIFLMALLNYLLQKYDLLKFFKIKGTKKYFLTVILGVVSSGSIFMWYPILKDLKKQGLKNNLIACFLYNRAIKIHLLPLILSVFSLKYTIILSLVMVFNSLLQSFVFILIDHFFPEFFAKD